MPTDSPSNVEETAKAVRWEKRAKRIFCLSIIAMPLGLFNCIGFSAIGAVLDSQKILDAKSAPGIIMMVIAVASLLLLVPLGLAGMLLMGRDRGRAARCVGLANLATKLRMRYTFHPEADKLSPFTHFKFINLQRVTKGASGKNLMQGTYEKHPLVSADYAFIYLFGNKLKSLEQTTIVFDEPFDHLPDCIVTKQGLGQKFEQLITGTPFGKILQVPDETEFNRQYVVAGVDQKAVLACLNPKIIEILMTDGNLTFVIQKGRLLVACQSVIVSLNDYESFLSNSVNLASVLGSRKGPRVISKVPNPNHGHSPRS